METLKKIMNIASSIMFYAFSIAMLAILNLLLIAAWGILSQHLLGNAWIGMAFQIAFTIGFIAVVILNVRDRLREGAGFWQVFAVSGPDSYNDDYDWERIDFKICQRRQA